MKSAKKITSLLLACIMVAAATACGGTPAASSAVSTAAGSSSAAQSTTSQSAENKPTLKVLSMYQDYNYEKQPSYALEEELTGYKVNWYMLPAENADQKLLLDISGGADYDLLLRMSPTGYTQLSSQGALMDLNDLLDKYGPNIKSKVSQFAWQSTTQSDGKINGIPHEDAIASLTDSYGMLRGGIGVRSDMLEEMGAKLPKTLDEFTQFLRDAKSKYGISPLTANKSSIFSPTIMMAFGMGDPGWYDVNGTYTHRIKHPQITEYLKYMQMLYKEKLLDNDMAINTSDNAKEKFVSKDAIALAPCMFWDIPGMVKALATNNPKCKIEFITGLAKDASTKPTFYIGRGANYFSCISQNAKHPEDAMKWLNAISDDKNFKRIYIGEEGISYKEENEKYYPIFTEGKQDVDFTAYQNSDKFVGVWEPTEAFKMWQARARKTPEMAEAFDAMNANVGDYNAAYNIESYGKASASVQKNYVSIDNAFADSFLKAVVEGTNPTKAISAMQAAWDKNGGLEVEKAMQKYYEANKQYVK